MREPVHFIPIVTTILALVFAVEILRRYRERRSGPHLLWWGLGILMFGVGTGTEAAVTLFGWSQGLFRAWYISGALLGGAPLAQGTVYLLLRRRTANAMAAALIAVVTVAAACVLLTPINPELAEAHRLSGRVMEWQWVRAFSPLVNLYALVFLVGGAAWSAVRYSRVPNRAPGRVSGNWYIAIGALLPGIGGAFTRLGYVRVLYAMELLGLVLIWAGYRAISRSTAPSVHPIQRELAKA